MEKRRRIFSTQGRGARQNGRARPSIPWMGKERGVPRPVWRWRRAVAEGSLTSGESKAGPERSVHK